MAARRAHGKRSIVAKLTKVRRQLMKLESSTVDRVALMEVAHAVLAIRQAQRFVRNAEHLMARTL